LIHTHELIFIVLRETSTFFHSVEEDTAATTLIYYIQESGIKDIAVFPASEEDKYAGTIYTQFAEFLERNTAPVFCISCWTSTYAVASDFAAMIRESHPASLIVAGGVHFNSMEEVNYSLKEDEFDIIFRGGGETFLEFIKLAVVDKSVKIHKKDDVINMSGPALGKGAFYLNNSEIQGQGRGSFTLPIVPLIGSTKDYADIRILLNDSCPNACDYCFIQPSGTIFQYWPKLISWVEDSADAVKKETGQKVILSLSDSAPFNKINRKQTVDYMRRQTGRVQFDGMNIFADPTDLDEEFYDIVDEFGIHNFFIGRDRIEQDDFIGRKCNGKLRSSEELDRELDMILDFMEYLNSGKNQLSKEIYIGYIISPYEKADYSRKLLQEFSKTVQHSSALDNIRVQSNIFLLNPYPGTNISKKSIGEFIPMRNFYYPYPNVWVGRNTVHIYLEIVRLVIAKMFCNNSNFFFYKPMLELAHSLQFRTDFNHALIDDIADRPLRDFAYRTVEKILKMNLGAEQSLDTYLQNILSVYYTGCMVSLVMGRPEFLKYKNLYDIIVKKDKAVSFLMRDLKMIKELTLAGKVPVLEKYL